MLRAVAVLTTLMMLGGCHEAGKEAGDDPTRSDETPGEGRPAVDSATQKPMATDRPMSATKSQSEATTSGDSAPKP